MKKYDIKLSAEIEESIRNRRNKLLHFMYIICTIVFIFVSFIDYYNENFIDATIEFFTLFFIIVLYIQLYMKKKYELASYFIVFLIAFAILALIHFNNFNNYSPVYLIPILLVTFFLFNTKRTLIINSIILIIFFIIFVINLNSIENSIFLKNTESVINFFLMLAIMAVFVYFVELTRIESYKMLLDVTTKKDLLYKEVHHRVKNNLNIVSSILAMQAQNEDKKVQKLIATSKTRIDSIAMVHSMLYVTNNLERVNAKEYIEKLVSHLKKTMSINIKIFKKIKNIELSLNEIIPLGLILNELLTNSFKYAFNDKKNPQIVIVLRIFQKNVMLNYYDNGSGKKNENENLGIKLIRLNIKQLKGKLKIKNENGLLYKISYIRDINV